MKPKWLLLFALGILLAPSPALAQEAGAQVLPECTFTATPPTIEIGSRSRLQWATLHATRGTITTVGNVAAQGSVYVTPSVTTTYTADFTGPGGVARCTARVVVVALGTGGGSTGGSSGGTISPGTITPGTVSPGETTGGTISPGQSSDGGTISPGTIEAGTIQGGTYEGPGFFPSAGSTIAPTTQSSQNVALDGEGLVPRSCAINSVENCDFCALGELLQRVINWMLTISVFVAAVMFAYAGILYFGSAGNMTRVDKAHKIFLNVAVGFVLVLGGWLFIQTLMNAIGNQTFFGNGWSWNKISGCDTARAARQNTIRQRVDQWINTSLPGLSTPTAPATVSTDSSVFGSAPAGYAACDQGYQLQGSSCVHPDSGDSYTARPIGPSFDSRYTGVNTRGTEQWAGALAAACAQSGLNDCAVAQAIMANECNSGNPQCLSHAGAAGLMQIMPATARGLDPGRLAGLSDNQVREILRNDPEYNMQLGTQELARLYNKYEGNVGYIAAAYNGGDKANVCGSTCQQRCDTPTAWQCTAFAGYNETRKYVPNVVATYNRVKSN